MKTQVSENVYDDAYKAITTCASLYAVPFATQCSAMANALERIKNGKPEDLELIVLESAQEISVFFQLYNNHTFIFIEKVSEALGNQIRRTTINESIRAMSVDSIALRLRQEALKPIELKFELVQSKILELGLQLDSVSTLKSAMVGGGTGAAIGHVFTDGKKTKDFATTGALIGIIAAENEKAELRKQIMQTCYEGISEISQSLERSLTKLADQYLALALGATVDFEKQDAIVKQLSAFGSQLTNICEKQFEIIKAAQVQFDQFGGAVIRIRKPIKTRVWVITYFVIMMLVSSTYDDAEKMNGFVVFLCPLIPYIVYKIAIQKRLRLAALSKLPSEIEKLENFMSSIPKLEKRLSDLTLNSELKITA